MTLPTIQFCRKLAADLGETPKACAVYAHILYWAARGATLSPDSVSDRFDFDEYLSLKSFVDLAEWGFINISVAPRPSARHSLHYRLSPGPELPDPGR